MPENNDFEANKTAYMIFEGSLMRSDKTNARLWILCIILTVLLVATNGLWIYYESQFEDKYIEIEAEQQADGNSNNYVVGGDYGGETNGESQD